jgi:hypothetical protein
MPPADDALDRRRATVRRRRLVAILIAVVAALGCTAVVVFALSTSRRVVVVKVLKKAPPTALPSATGDGEVSPYAPSDAQVAQELKQTEGASTGGTEIESAAGVLDRGADASFAQLNRTLPEKVQIAILPLNSYHVQTLGGDVPAHGWSTTKVPVLAALLKARGSRGLTSSEGASARSAITASSNQSILNLFADLKQIKGGLVGASAYIEGLFRLSGDQETVVATAPPPSGAVTTFGQTEWSPTASVRFMSALGRGCLLSSAMSSYILGLMQEIEASESWGLGSAGFSSVAFKGGWGPERSGDYLVRQVGIVNVGSSRAVAVAIVATPSGSFAAGTETLNRAALWLRHHLRAKSGANASCQSH